MHFCISAFLPRPERIRKVLRCHSSWYCGHFIRIGARKAVTVRRKLPYVLRQYEENQPVVSLSLILRYGYKLAKLSIDL